MVQRNSKLHLAWVLGLILAVIMCVGTVFSVFSIFILGGAFTVMTLVANILSIILVFKALSYTKRAYDFNDKEMCRLACLGWILSLTLNLVGLLLALPCAVLCLNQINNLDGGVQYGM